MTRRTKIGIVLVAWPFVGLFTVLTLYAIVSFVFSSIAGAAGDYGFLVQEVHAQTLAAREIVQESGEVTLVETAGSLVKVLLGLFGVIAILGIFVSVPVGIYFIATGNKDEKAVLKK